MKVFSKSKWIWLNEEQCNDQYVQFRDSLVRDAGHMAVRLSCDSDYTLFVNETYVASNQYGDFEHYKIYDTIDITPFLKDGENTLTFVVHHCGTPTSRYRPAKAGLIYEVLSDGTVVGFSSEKTQCRLSPFYKSGWNVLVSTQLGHSFSYDSNGDENTPFSAAACVEKHCEFYERPIKKSTILPRRPMKSVTRIDDTHYLIDLGGEVVGLPSLELISETEQTVTVAWGEHVKDGCVRQVISYRNFYYEYRAHAGHNYFTEYMLRLGCRYIEVFAEHPITLCYAGVLPQVYEVEEIPCYINDPLDRSIYDICVNTLRLCMMEHYVDCPWREQALYSFDSRNQMLFGYLTFRDKNAQYARANLKLMGMDRRDDGLLSITYPCGIRLTIPSFSLHYILSVWEYVDHVGDTTLAEELMPKMKELLEVFVSKMRDGLIESFEGKDYWNFYDWSPYGTTKQDIAPVPDFLINALFVMALEAFNKICQAIGAPLLYHGLEDEIRTNMRRAFLCETGLFTVLEGQDAQTLLANTFAILSGTATPKEARLLCDHIVKGSLADCSLSNKIFVYQALLKTDSEAYREFILREIRRNYKIMLDADSDTVWETMAGEKGFSGMGAGSLCHGWSAVPIYIYHKLGIATPNGDQ